MSGGDSCYWRHEIAAARALAGEGKGSLNLECIERIKAEHYDVDRIADDVLAVLDLDPDEPVVAWFVVIVDAENARWFPFETVERAAKDTPYIVA
jgi:hypothetical protein